MAQDYHNPPPTPRDRMWEAISAYRAEARVIPIQRRRGPRTLTWITALAATLVLGVALDRLVLRPAQPVSEAATATQPSIALQLVTTQHLSQMETFLTGFRIAEEDSLFSSQARDLLTSTRLLLDNPGVRDPRVRSLLQDLELILVQIVQSGTTDRPSERQLITDGLQQRQVLPRLRSQIPAGPPHLGAS
jgi:hypothetical protein